MRHQILSLLGVPLFPEFAAALGEAFDAAPEGAKYVVAGKTYREASNTSGGGRFWQALARNDTSP